MKVIVLRRKLTDTELDILIQEVNFFFLVQLLAIRINGKNLILSILQRVKTS